MNIDLIRNILNILFMALALAAVITYFVASVFKVNAYCWLGAIFLKLVEFFMRFML